MGPSPEAAGQSGGVSITGAIGTVVGDIIGGNKVTGATAEELVAALEKEGFIRKANKGGLERRTVIALARRLRPHDERLDFKQAVAELERAVEIALDLIERGERGTNDDAFVGAVLARIAESIRRDDLDGGANAVDAALTELEASYRRSRIALLEEGVKVDTLRRDVAAVTRRIEAIVAINCPTDRLAWLQEFRARYDAFWVDGSVKGINFSLSVAIELARRMVATARNADERALALNLLGLPLRALGDREVGTARLEEAVAAFHAALEELPRKRWPLDWATTKNNLGATLFSLGERDGGLARLAKAVAAFLAALEEMTLERDPLGWAGTLTKLGIALRVLGEREGGTARLEEAAAAHCSALQVLTRERDPLGWARTLNNLGVVLWALGEREGGTARLEEAATAHRAALEVLTRERAPLDWALTQSNLGDALRVLGEREGGTARLEEAVAAYCAALKERTRERMPLHWATTQMNLGSALGMLGEREGGTARLEEAVRAFDACLMITASVWPKEWIEDVRRRRDEVRAEIPRHVPGGPR